MPAIECDNCERTFDADPREVSGGKIACPFCGDVNRVAETAAPADGHDFPPDHGPEQEILTLHPAMFRAHPFRYVFIVALLAAGIAVVVWANGAERPQWLQWPGLVLSAVAVGGWLWWYVSASLWIKLRLSNKRTTRREGIIKRNTSEVLHDHVRNVEIRQNFLQRIMNVGYLGISSSGQDGIEIQIRDVPKPYEVKALIDRYRDM